jgi:tetratricopeptide (TPR) repeat protein
MVGNEMTSALWISATLAALVANERRDVPSLKGDALTGLAAGLALLAKFSGVLALATALVVPVVRGLGSRHGMRRGLTRALVVGVVAAVLAGPFYLRNLIEFGTPFRMSRVDPLVAEIESKQPPGERSWRDFVSISPLLFVEPNPKADHLLHSVWGTLYVTGWSDTRWISAHIMQRTRTRLGQAQRVMMALGVIPTALALLGAVALLLDLRRGHAIALPLLVCCALTLVSVVGFAITVPTYAALKSSYLLGLSIPYGVFVARAGALLARRSRWLATAGALGVVVAAAATFVTDRVGSLRGPLPESWLAGPVLMHFGEYDESIALYRSLMLGRPLLIGPLSENIAAVEIAVGRPERAQAIYRRLEERGIAEPWRANQYAVANALVGNHTEALRWFDAALDAGAGAVALANRGAVRVAEGDLARAEADLRAALEADPHLAPAWWTLAEVNARSGQDDAASDARERGLRAARRAPRGRPYGFGAPLGESPGMRFGWRWLLRVDGDELGIAHPPFREGI